MRFDMIDKRLNGNELGTRLDDGIKKAFTFPFFAYEHCKPDGSTHFVPDRNFHLNGHFVVLYNIKLFPGLTFRALKVNTGDLNVFTQDVEFEVEIPTIGGYFYTVSDDKSLKPVHQRGSFKINYATVIAKGITNFFLNIDRLGICNMAMDFELIEKPRVTLYSHEADGSFGPLDSNRAENEAKVAQVLWPSVKPLLYWIFRDKLWKMGSQIPWSDPLGRTQFALHEKCRRSKVGDVLKEIMTGVQRKLSEKTKAGRLPMPDIDAMVAWRYIPEIWGRFKATSGWLGDMTSMRVSDHTPVHARSKNEIVIVGQIYFTDWKYCYDKYEMEANTKKATGNIIASLEDNEALITITAMRNDEGVTVLKDGRFEYINATRNDHKIMGLCNLCWMEKYIKCWMSGLMDEGKPVLNKTINDALNEVLVDVDIFKFWDELYAQRVIDGNPMKSDEDHSADSDCEDYSGDDSVGDSSSDDWEKI